MIDDDMNELSLEEKVQFQHFMMQKTLRKFGLTEVMLLNDLIVAFNNCLCIVSEILDDEEFIQFAEQSNADILGVMTITNYYMSLIAEEENNYLEDFTDE